VFLASGMEPRRENCRPVVTYQLTANGGDIVSARIND